MRRLFWLLVLLIAASGCHRQSADTEAEKFLKWSMNQYASFKSFKAAESWSMSSDAGDKMGQTREIAFAPPNRFRVLTTAGSGTKMASISDSKKLVEYADLAGATPSSTAAPANIQSATAMQIKHPIFNGSLIYQLFGGSDNYDSLVDSARGEIAFGEERSSSTGEPCKTVKFVATGNYGNTEMLIGKQTGIVYEIRYDGLAEMMKDTPAVQAYGSHTPKMSVIETFTSVSTDASLPESTFDTTVPKEIAAKADVEGNPPVPLGKHAPDAEFTGLDGKKVKLSALKGHVVMIDFWATWCQPCRKGLPVTDQLHKAYAGKGLKVMTVSTEEIPKVRDFITANKYSFPAFVDTDGSASSIYHVDGIPCLVILDAKGNLSSYFVGLHPEEQVIAGLKKAGLKI